MGLVVGAYIVTTGKPDLLEHRHYIIRMDGPTLEDDGHDKYVCRCQCGHVWIGRGRNIEEAFDAAYEGFDEHTAKVAGVVNKHINAGVPEQPGWIGKYRITSYPIRSSKVTGNWNRI